ncbi:MAG: B12-binding domain-containing radical SAM protein [Proteobacteria bacterium]|nr:B12-binding domain-containing radical SAM protein [Pseudomonadota bacterium]
MPDLKKALLVYPEVPKDTYWSYSHSLRFIHKKSAMPPLGLATLAAMFPPDIALRIVDMNVTRLTDRDLEWADTVFLSAMIVQKESFLQVVGRCRDMGKTMVAGGPYPTSSSGEMEEVDYLVLGEAEDIFADFLEKFRAGSAPRVTRAATVPDIRHAPVPRFDLLDRNAYASMAVQYSRGCPFKCEFCNIWKVYGNRPRLKAAQSVLAEMDALYGLGWRGPVFIVDDNFIGNKGRVKKELLPALHEWQAEHGYPFRFFTEASINLAADDELMGAMRKAGFNEVFIGIETPSQEGLAETGKLLNLKTDMPQAVKKIQSYGMEVMAGFILGFDSDTEDIAERQIRFIQETGIARAMVGLLIALPGTELYDRMRREGRLLSETDGNNTHMLESNIETRLSKERLAEGYRKIMGSIYDKNLKNYFQRCSKVLEAVSNSPTLSREIRWQEIAIILRSLVSQSFTPYGFQYLRFLSRTIRKHPKTFAEAVKFGIVGHHFHTITQKMLTAPAPAS